jgi:hypothetical protein
MMAVIVAKWIAKIPAKAPSSMRIASFTREQRGSQGSPLWDSSSRTFSQKDRSCVLKQEKALVKFPQQSKNWSP